MYQLLLIFIITEAATVGVLWKKVILKNLQNSQENTCARVFFNKVAGVSQALAQVFSFEFCEASIIIIHYGCHVPCGCLMFHSVILLLERI